MIRLEKIDSLDRPELAPYRTLRRSSEHEQHGIFVAEGDKVVRRLLESNFGVVSLLLPIERVAEFEPLVRAQPEQEIFIFAVTKKSVLEELVGFKMFQGVLAVGRIPEVVTLETILADTRTPRLFVAVDELANSENLGLLVRNSLAFGAQALIVGETCSSPFLRRSVRNSMGTIFQLPVLELGRASVPAIRATESPDGSRGRSPHQNGLAEALRELRSRGIRVIAAHPHTEKKLISQADFRGDLCIVFGSEGTGISPEVLAACDEAVAIPMANEVDSLNVAAAAAVFLYEAQRQRTRS